MSKRWPGIAAPKPDYSSSDASGMPPRPAVPRSFQNLVTIPREDLVQMAENAERWSKAPLESSEWIKKKLFLDMQIVQYLGEADIPGRSGVAQKRQYLKQFADIAEGILASLTKLELAQQQKTQLQPQQGVKK